MKIKIIVAFSLFMIFLSCDKDSTSSKIGSLYLIEVIPTTMHIEIDSTYQFLAVGKDIDGNVINYLTFTWTSQYPAVGAVDENGLFTALSSGTTFLSAKSGNIESTQATVNVYDPVFSIEIQQDSISVYVDSAAQFTAISKDMNGDTINYLSFTWETGDNNIATINDSGIVTGVAIGNTTIVAKIREVESTPSVIIVRDLKIGTVTDIDGNIYKTVKIGEQWWMAENLKVTHYRNGNDISHVTDNTEWSDLTTGAYCEFYNDESNVETYGRLYNWYAIIDSRNIAPEGWHVPTDEQWKQLEMNIGMNQDEVNNTGWRGNGIGNKLKSSSGWFNYGNGTDDYQFAGLPGGCRGHNGAYYDKGSEAIFWSTTEYDNYTIWARYLSSRVSTIGRNYYFNYKSSGFSVRCIKG